MVRIGERPLAELTDEELEAELQRRRRARGRGQPTSDTPRLAAAARREQVRKWYASLELRPGASRDQVEAAYRKLSVRYDPDKHAGHPDKHRVATELARGLREAYDGLLEHLRAPR